MAAGRVEAAVASGRVGVSAEEEGAGVAAGWEMAVGGVATAAGREAETEAAAATAEEGVQEVETAPCMAARAAEMAVVSTAVAKAEVVTGTGEMAEVMVGSVEWQAATAAREAAERAPCQAVAAASAVQRAARQTTRRYSDPRLG